MISRDYFANNEIDTSILPLNFLVQPVKQLNEAKQGANHRLVSSKFYGSECVIGIAPNKLLSQIIDYEEFE